MDSCLWLISHLANDGINLTNQKSSHTAYLFGIKIDCNFAYLDVSLITVTIGTNISYFESSLLVSKSSLGVMTANFIGLAESKDSFPLKAFL